MDMEIKMQGFLFDVYIYRNTYLKICLLRKFFCIFELHYVKHKRRGWNNGSKPNAKRIGNLKNTCKDVIFFARIEFQREKIDVLLRQDDKTSHSVFSVILK